MATSKPTVYLSTTVSANQLPSYANDAAFVTAKGSSAANGDHYYNTTLNTHREYVNGSWVNAVLTSQNSLTASKAAVTDGSGLITTANTSATEIGYVAGVTSAIQTQIDTKAPIASPTFTGNITTPLTASRALTTDGSSRLAVSATTSTELGYVNGVTSAIQTQLNLKAPLASPAFTGTPTALLGGTNFFQMRNAGTAGSGGVLILENTASTTTGDPCAPLFIQKQSTTNTSSQLFSLFYINNGSTGSGGIAANGASTAAFVTVSDERLKTAIETLPPQLENISRLRPAEFEYRDKEKCGDGRQIGFIAQEIGAVYPDAVSPDAEGYLRLVGWDKTSARLVKAIQELKAEIDELKKTKA